MIVTTKTRKELYQIWIDALRSGQYKQGHNALRRINNKNEQLFCCLGVLCDVIANNGGPQWNGGSGEYMYHVAELSSDLRALLNFGYGQIQILIELNDNNKKDFNTIANYIETTIMPDACA
jgi:hypothetical protein